MTDASLEQALHEHFNLLSKGLDFTISNTQQDKLVKYVLMLNKWNKAYNLSSVRDPHQMLIKHIFDSIVVSPFLRGQSFADIGTGPGLPGIPLAIMNDDKQFTLVDSLGKRIRFIKQVVHDLGINNVKTEQARVENISVNSPFDGVLSRAFASLEDMLTWCHHLTDEQGEFLALKGQIHQDEINRIPAQFTLVQSIPLLIPSLDGKRHLIKIKKNHREN